MIETGRQAERPTYGGLCRRYTSEDAHKGRN